MQNTFYLAIRSLAIALLFSASIITPKHANAEEIYMIRGFLNVFSDGMNQMTRRLRSAGLRASVHSNGDWQSLARNIIARARRKQVSYPIIIAGHSLGAVEAPNFANTLGKAGVPVALVIGLDPGFSTPPPFGKGVRQVVNYKIPSGQYFRRGPGFTGTIKTIDVSRYGVDHVGIDKNRSVQNLVIRRIRAVARK